MTYQSIWVTTFSAFYLLSSTQVMDISSLLLSSPPEEYARTATWLPDAVKRAVENPSFKPAVEAFLATKAVEPIRWATTFAVTPKVSELVRKWRKGER